MPDAENKVVWRILIEHISQQCKRKIKYLPFHLQAHCLKKEQLAKRVVHVIDIANDPIKNSVQKYFLSCLILSRLK